MKKPQTGHTTPKVSIGLPVYNGEDFLKEALDSILSQTFKDFELVISDNASTDKTEEICLEYAAKDQRIRYYRNNQNLGAAWNYNRVFKLSNGKYFKWAAHDDICAPTFIASCVEVLDRDEAVVLCYPQTEHIDENGKLKLVHFSSPQCTDCLEPQKRFHDILLNELSCEEVFGLIRADILRSTSLIGTYFSSDKVLLAELSLYGRFQALAEALYFRRSHPKQATNISVSEKYTWITTQGRHWVPFQAKALRGYWVVVRKAPLSRSQKLACYISVVHLLRLRLSKWQSLLLPGSNNYFGVGANRSSRAKALS